MRKPLRDAMLPVKDAAKRLGISPSLLYQMASSKEIPHYRVKGCIRFKPEDLDAYLECCRVGMSEERSPRVPTHAAFTQLDPARLRRAWREQGVL